MSSQCLELVGGGHERQIGYGGDLGREFFREAGLGVEARADGSAALGETVKARQHPAHTLNPELDLRGVARKLLAERERCRVLKVCAAYLDQILPTCRLGRERLVEPLELRQQLVMDLLHRRDVHGGGKAVVRRLPHVDVVVGMDRLFGADLAAEDLDSAIGDDLVHVHVGLGAGAGLPHHQREIAGEPTLDDLIGRPERWRPSALA